MKDINNDLIKKINEFFIIKNKEIPIKILKTSNDNAYLCLFEYTQPQNGKGICIYCSRKTNIKSKAGYICSSERKSKCRYIFICPVCNKIFIPQHAYQCLSKENVTCSHKCCYEITINKWRKENPEEAHKEAIKNGYRNINIMRKSLEIIQKDEPKKFKKWCASGGKIGGAITAKIYPEIWKENLKNETKYCKLCNAITYHQGNVCMECNAKSKGFKSKLDKQIILQNNHAISLGFKNWGDFCKSYGAGFHLSFCIKCNKQTLHNGNRCFVCNPWEGGILPNFIEDNNCSLHSSQILKYKGECWDCYKEKFKSFIILPKEFKKYNAFWQNTYRLNKFSRKGQLAMEQELIDKNIEWFVYIKFYEVNNDIKPLVVGKTGSKLVNKSGTDIIFSTNVDEGPSKIFLKECNYNWHINKILIISVKNEILAYELEKQITKEYNLFSS